jgi:hypothetical protein
MKSERERAIRETTIDALTGSVAMELLGVLAEEQVRGGEERREGETWIKGDVMKSRNIVCEICIVPLITQAVTVAGVPYESCGNLSISHPCRYAHPQSKNIPSQSHHRTNMMIFLYFHHQGRVVIFDRMQCIANVALSDRCRREAAESGRRQKEEIMMKELI